jgi:hypothetical protein
MNRSPPTSRHDNGRDRHAELPVCCRESSPSGGRLGHAKAAGAGQSCAPRSSPAGRLIRSHRSTSYLERSRRPSSQHQWSVHRRTKGTRVTRLHWLLSQMGSRNGLQGTRPAAAAVHGILSAAEPSPPGSPMRTSDRSVSHPCSARVSATSRSAVYGPVCTVVWEGWSREAPPYPDHCPKAVLARSVGHGAGEFVRIEG